MEQQGREHIDQQAHPADDIGELETTRLYLRQPIRADAAILYRQWLDPQIQQFLGGVVTPVVAKLRMTSLLEHWEHYGYGNWSIFERTSDTLIGLAGLGHCESEVEISYRFFPEFWGHGYATEAAQASIEIAFEWLGMERLVGVTQQANAGSQRVLEKIGMRHTRDFVKWNSPQYYYEIERATQDE